MTKKFKVSIPYVCWVGVTVEAEDEETAIELAYGQARPHSVIGNGGNDKLIGVDGDHTIEVDDEPADNFTVGDCEAEEVE